MIDIQTARLWVKDRQAYVDIQGIRTIIEFQLDGKTVYAEGYRYTDSVETAMTKQREASK